MRRVGVVLALAALVIVPTAPARTIKVDWREQKQMEGGGALKFHVTKIVATTRSWAVTATIQNATSYSVAIDPQGQPLAFPSENPLWEQGMALIEAHRVKAASVGYVHLEWWQHKATTFRPALPKSLGPHRSWTGTMSGRGTLRKGQAFSVGFGLFQSQSPASGGQTIIWITDGSFTL